ncbi:hypothetical protein ACGFRG_16400 [Streptomyces sp. NPDC048696]|uniref:hypothetical protein n=1 Tax=Streptomyces sp. NPDC048696 TaxID=3365585 RepID=UPI00371FFD82
MVVARLARELRAAAGRQWSTTPGRLRFMGTGCALLGAGLLILLVVAATGASGTWDAIEHRNAPRTVAATELDLALNDLDAQTANILLSSGDSGTGKGRLDRSYTEARGRYTSAQETISRSLRTLGAASEGDKGTEDAVVALTDEFAHYQEFVGRALENDGHPGGKDAARADYRSATDLLAHVMLPGAGRLVDANDTVYQADYRAAHSDVNIQLAAEIVLGGLLVAALVWLQIQLARRFGRVLNPGLLAATLCALVAVASGAQLLTTTSHQLTVARHDSFDSVVALSRSKALGYDLNADESRYLLDPDHRTEYATGFLEKSRRLYGVAGDDVDAYGTQLEVTWAAYRNDSTDKKFTGEYRRELDNLTFPGEREAAEKTVDAFVVYQRDDREFRGLVARNKIREATEFCVGWAPDTSNAHFGAWMQALDEVTAINSRHHARAIASGRTALADLAPTAGAGLVLMVGLVACGLRPRLAEYR